MVNMDSPCWDGTEVNVIFDVLCKPLLAHSVLPFNRDIWQGLRHTRLRFGI